MIAISDRAGKSEKQNNNGAVEIVQWFGKKAERERGIENETETKHTYV